MTETEWLDCPDARGMLEYQYRQAIAEKPALLVGLPFWLKGRPNGIVSDRKLRLFACACCRCAWDNLDDDTRRVIEVAEEAADRRVSRGELRQATARNPLVVWLKAEQIREQPAWLFLNLLAAGDPEKREDHMALLRHILGNPYRPIPSVKFWPSPVIHLAEGAIRQPGLRIRPQRRLAGSWPPRFGRPLPPGNAPSERLLGAGPHPFKRPLKR